MSQVHAVGIKHSSVHTYVIGVRGQGATVDLGESSPMQVSELTVRYETTYDMLRGTGSSKVTTIAYQGEDGETAWLHPDFLEQRDTWPAWLPDVVSKYDPANN